MWPASLAPYAVSGFPRSVRMMLAGAISTHPLDDDAGGCCGCVVVTVDVLVTRVVEVCSPVVNGEGVSGPDGVGDGGVGVGVAPVDDDAGIGVEGVDDDEEGEFVPPGTGLADPGPTPPPGQVDGAQLSAWIVIS